MKPEYNMMIDLAVVAPVALVGLMTWRAARRARQQQLRDYTTKRDYKTERHHYE